MKRLLLITLTLFSSGLAHAEERYLERILLLPEPKVMRNPLSYTPEGAESTVLTPARELADVPGIIAYSQEDFKKLGLSVVTFVERAKKVADKRLSTIKPEFIKDDEGRIKYAVYRGDSPLIASLMVAPSLSDIFEPYFGKIIWVAMPDRHSLFIFPANADSLEEFTADLAERYLSDPRAASSEIFALQKNQAPRVVASFNN
jgi:hypothetical protein